jgi:hypothetical protein
LGYVANLNMVDFIAASLETLRKLKRWASSDFLQLQPVENTGLSDFQTETYFIEQQIDASRVGAAPSLPSPLPSNLPAPKRRGRNQKK